MSAPMFDERVHQVIEDLERFIPTVDDALALPRPAAELVHALIRIGGYRRGVEIGTSYGYSGLWIASALRAYGGRLVTIDHDPRKREAARARFAEAGLAEVVDSKTGTALDVLAELTGPFDFALIDADKENCVNYFRLLAPRMGPRSLIVTDNTTTHAEALAPFLSYLDELTDWHTCVTPVGNGMALSVQCG